MSSFELKELEELLPDDFQDSKDWKSGGILERVRILVGIAEDYKECNEYRLYVEHPETNEKARKICSKEGFKPTGYILTNSSGGKCHVDLGNILWPDDYQSKLNEFLRDYPEFYKGKF